MWLMALGLVTAGTVLAVALAGGLAMMVRARIRGDQGAADDAGAAAERRFAKARIVA